MHDGREEARRAPPAADPQRGYTIGRHGRNWTVKDPRGAAGVHHRLPQGRAGGGAAAGGVESMKGAAAEPRPCCSSRLGDDLVKVIAQSIRDSVVGMRHVPHFGGEDPP